jgi:hypothetical protein
MMTSGRYSHLTFTNPQVWYSETPSGQLFCKTKYSNDHYRSTLYTTGVNRTSMVRHYPHGSLISIEKAIGLKRLMTFVPISTLVLAYRSITNTTYHLAIRHISPQRNTSSCLLGQSALSDQRGYKTSNSWS